MSKSVCYFNYEVDQSTLEGRPVFILTLKDYFDRNQALSDRSLRRKILPDEFYEITESLYGVSNLSKEEATVALIKKGHEHNDTLSLLKICKPGALKYSIYFNYPEIMNSHYKKYQTYKIDIGSEYYRLAVLEGEEC